MFKRKWPLWSLMSVLFVGITLAGCSSDSDKTADGSGGSADEPITLTFFNADLTSDVSFDDTVAKR